MKYRHDLNIPNSQTFCVSHCGLIEHCNVGLDSNFQGLFRGPLEVDSMLNPMEDAEDTMKDGVMDLLLSCLDTAKGPLGSR